MKANKELFILKRQLRDTDYKVIKYIEGKLPFNEFEEVKLQRQLWRDRINELEKEE